MRFFAYLSVLLPGLLAVAASPALQTGQSSTGSGSTGGASSPQKRQLPDPFAPVASGLDLGSGIVSVVGQGIVSAFISAIQYSDRQIDAYRF